MRLQLALGIFLAFFLLEANACSCIQFDIEKSYSKALYVFEAKITKSELILIKEELDDQELMHERVNAQIEIVRSWKGSANDLSGLITSVGSGSCGVPLNPGRTYLFFVYATWEQGIIFKKKYGEVSICGNPFTLDYNHHLYLSTIEWLENQGSNENSHNNGN